MTKQAALQPDKPPWTAGTRTPSASPPRPEEAQAEALQTCATCAKRPTDHKIKVWRCEAGGRVGLRAIACDEWQATKDKRNAEEKLLDEAAAETPRASSTAPKVSPKRSAYKLASTDGRREKLCQEGRGLPGATGV